MAYESADDGPEAKLFRQQQWEQERRERAIDALLTTLTPEDGARELFSFWEIKLWGLKTRRKRPKHDG